MTPPPTPSRSATNGISQQQQSSTPFQQQASLTAPQPVYPPIFLPVQANVSQRRTF